jgi:hypothetical protein
MLVTYIYRSDDGMTPGVAEDNSPKKSSADDSKSFSFWTLFDLGNVQVRAARSVSTGA